MARFKVNDRVIGNAKTTLYKNKKGTVVKVDDRAMRTHVKFDQSGRVIGMRTEKLDLLEHETTMRALGPPKVRDLTDDELLAQLGLDDEPAPKKKLPRVESKPQPILTMRDGFLFEYESKRPKYEGQSLEWHREGRCPQCGELGRYHLSTAICSKHGTY
jgi:hypothetical protein